MIKWKERKQVELLIMPKKIKSLLIYVLLRWLNLAKMLSSNSAALNKPYQIAHYYYYLLLFPPLLFWCPVCGVIEWKSHNKHTHKMNGIRLTLFHNASFWGKQIWKVTPLFLLCLGDERSSIILAVENVCRQLHQARHNKNCFKDATI